MSADDHTDRERVHSASGHDISRLDRAEIDALAAGLSEDEARIILRQGTERPFCGAFLDSRHDGVYACRLCGLPLFASDTKFDSGTGWPSFFAPIDPDHVAFVDDRSHGMVRREIVCRRCHAHLGHVFPDGPEPTGERYCLNSVSLEFFEPADLPDRSRPRRA